MKFLLLFLAFFITPEKELEKHTRQFATKSRDSCSRSIRKSQEYVIKECKSYGLQVQSQGMLIRGRECRNIIAWREGKDKNKIVIIGAHLDSYNNPGADDNASGSACLLLLAKRFAKGPEPKCTVSFQWYTGEELGLLGSKFYVKYPLLPKGDPDIKKHVFMLNLDMVGRLKFRPQKDDVQEILEKLFPKYPFAKSITFREGSDSDHASFDVPIVFLHTGIHKDHHKRTDTPEKLNYRGMVVICDYAFEIIIKTIDGKIPNYILWQLPILEKKHEN